MKTFKNILIVRTDRIGDVVLTVPAVRAVRRAFPDARISFWVAPETKDIVDGLPFIDEVLTKKRKNGLREYLDFLFLLRRKKFDLAVIYHTKRHTNTACFLAGIPVRLGYCDNKLGFLLTHPVEDRRHFGEKHEAEYCLDLLRTIGIEDHDLKLELALQKDAEVWAERFVAEHAGKGLRLVAVHPDASCPTRRWPVLHFAALMDRLSMEAGVKVVLVGAPSAVPLAREMQGLLKCDILDLTGQTTLAQLTSLLSRCALVVSNDTGPVHVAAALGIPTVTIFMRQQPGINPQRWKPLGDKSVTLMNKPGEEIMVDRHSRVISSRFDSITVEEVFQTSRTLLSRFNS